MDTPEQLFFVMELAHVGELFDIITKGSFKESKAKFYFYQMAKAVEYLHSKVCIYPYDIIDHKYDVTHFSKFS